jgi:hypothetical protein
VIRNLFAVISFMAFATSGIAQDSCACCTRDHRAFDFWVGQWEVVDSLNTRLGKNTVSIQQNGCVIQELWTSSRGGFSGTSYSYFDRQDSTWNQVWVDNQGGVLNLKGGKKADGSIAMKSALADGGSGLVANAVKWERLPSGNVLQTWSVVDEHGQELKIVFRGIYQKVNEKKIGE